MAENITYTVNAYLSGKVSYPVSDELLASACADRGVSGEAAHSEVPSTTLRLLYADILKSIALGPSRVGSVSDKDNGWSHTDGGYTLTKDDKRLLLNEANGIYEELEPGSVVRVGGIKLHSFGICGAMYDMGGTPLPRIEQ